MTSRKVLRFVIFIALFTFGTTRVPEAGNRIIGISRRKVTLVDRLGCDNTKVEIPNRVNTTSRLAKLREQMTAYKVSAYIITSNDAHQSEMVSDHDERRKYISGFSGSAGTAVVTLNSAAMWTDSRYYIEAEQQLDCNWVLMKSGLLGVPTMSEWIVSELKQGENVSADPRTITYTEWETWRQSFEGRQINMVVREENLVDLIWTEAEGRPPVSDEPIVVHDMKYTGLSWEEKLCKIRKIMKEEQVDVTIFAALDEIAWILNLRGGDVPCTPVFLSYLIVGLNWTTVYFSKSKVNDDLIAHLNTDGAQNSESVKIKDYDDIWKDLPDIGKTATKISLPLHYSYAQGTSYLVHNLLNTTNIEYHPSSALLLKDRKNSVEAANMITAHIKDAVALVNFLSILETDILSGSKNWTEIKVAEVLDGLRNEQPGSAGLSFPTISAFGTNAALPHYSPTPETNKIIDRSAPLMIDSGGQYLDGTTDVTRTVHYGTPTKFQIEVYTRLLMGCIDIVTTVFPPGTKVSDLESIIRGPLHEIGLDYGHGSTHGIGSFLNVHEAYNTTYNINFFGSQEPGYYKENDFGMRLENIITVVKAITRYRSGHRFLTFDAVTLVPYERNLINTKMLSKKQVTWLNNYHAKVREVVGNELLKQGLQEAYQWLVKKTEPISLKDIY